MRKTIIFITILLIFTPALVMAKTAAKAPVDPDSDHDGLSDKWEKIIGTDSHNMDTDGDGYSDGLEVKFGYNPLDPSPSKQEKTIKVDLKTQNLTYYFAGKKLESFPISSGVKKMPTPPGQFQVLKKIPVADYRGPHYNYPNTKWNLQFATSPEGNYYIHGAYWHHNFGHPMSSGCVNVSYQNMEKLYDFAQVGTKISID